MQRNWSRMFWAVTMMDLITKITAITVSHSARYLLSLAMIINSYWMRIGKFLIYLEYFEEKNHQYQTSQRSTRKSIYRKWYIFSKRKGFFTGWVLGNQANILKVSNGMLIDKLTRTRSCSQLFIPKWASWFRRRWAAQPSSESAGGEQHHQAGSERAEEDGRESPTHH